MVLESFTSPRRSGRLQRRCKDSTALCSPEQCPPLKSGHCDCSTAKRDRSCYILSESSEFTYCILNILICCHRMNSYHYRGMDRIQGSDRRVQYCLSRLQDKLIGWCRRTEPSGGLPSDNGPSGGPSGGLPSDKVDVALYCIRRNKDARTCTPLECPSLGHQNYRFMGIPGLYKMPAIPPKLS